MILFLIICTDSESVDCLLQNKKVCGRFRTKTNEKEGKKAALTLSATFSAVRSLNRQSVTGMDKNVHRTTILALRFPVQS